jgi:excinuclease UvrABC nuclease subunit
MSATATWLTYEFGVYTPSTAWNDVAGVYIFAGVNAQNRWVALYVGQAESLRDRFSSHEQWGPAIRLGATHIHACVITDAGTRDAVERELIQACQPRLNTQLK